MYLALFLTWLPIALDTAPPGIPFLAMLSDATVSGTCTPNARSVAPAVVLLIPTTLAACVATSKALPLKRPIQIRDSGMAKNARRREGGGRGMEEPLAETDEDL